MMHRSMMIMLRALLVWDCDMIKIILTKRFFVKMYHYCSKFFWKGG